MKKILVLMLITLPLLAGCMATGQQEITMEEVQALAQQTIDARNAENGVEIATATVSSGLVIRPIQATSMPTTDAVTGGDFISRPIFNTATPVPVIPTVPQPTVVYAQQVSTVCERMRFLEDVTIPDDTLLQPGQQFRKTWKIQNAGSCTWSAGYQLVWSGGDQMGQTYAVNIPQAVPSGDTIEISVDMKAPLTSGSYQSEWMMRSPSGSLFGTANSDNSAIWAKIVVGTSANVSTVAPEVTPVNAGCQILSVEPAYGSVFAPGEETDFYIRVMNTGSSTWTADNIDVAYIGGENMLKRKDDTRKDLPYDVPVRGTLYFGMDAVVPSERGTYTMTMGILDGNTVLCTMDITIRAVD